jgi:hypothetical protein
MPKRLRELQNEIFKLNDKPDVTGISAICQGEG